MQVVIGARLAAHGWPGGVRVGIHCGEAARTAAGLVGLEVHRAARLAAAGYGGQVLVSEAAAVLVRAGLPHGAWLADLGVRRLKDLGRPERIFQLHAADLPAEFPPLRSLGNPALRNNLPAVVSAYIGRVRELAGVGALVEIRAAGHADEGRGCGKTRLGLQVAAELLDGSGDGVWLAELAAVTGEDAVAAAICETLRLAVSPGRRTLEALLDALEPQDVLIVVDKCEHLVGECARTAEAILRRCPRVNLLATSRERLGIGGEVIYRVPSLLLPGSGNSEPGAASSCIYMRIDETLTSQKRETFWSRLGGKGSPGWVLVSELNLVPVDDAGLLPHDRRHAGLDSEPALSQRSAAQARLNRESGAGTFDAAEPR